LKITVLAMTSPPPPKIASENERTIWRGESEYLPIPRQRMTVIGMSRNEAKMNSGRIFLFSMNILFSGSRTRGIEDCLQRIGRKLDAVERPEIRRDFLVDIDIAEKFRVQDLAHPLQAERRV